MITTSTAWNRTLQGSHEFVSRARVCVDFQTGKQPTGTILEVVDGEATIDANAANRVTADLTVVGDWPTFNDDLLTPYGNEVYVQIGLRYSDALVEYVGLGYLRIDQAEQENPPDGPMRLTLTDRMSNLVDGRLLKPRQFLTGTTIGSIVDNLVTEIYPDAVIEWDDNDEFATLVRPVIVEEDRWAFIDDIVDARGKIWYWDDRGVLVIKELPDPLVPVYAVSSGTLGTLVAVQRTLSREGVYNAVVASGEATDTNAPVRGIAVDNDPNSPTFFGGRFGSVPRFYSSPLLTTSNQCQKAARTILSKVTGLPYLMQFGAVSNPALEPYDPVTVSFKGKTGEELHALDVLRIPLGTGAPMEADCRQRLQKLISTSEAI